MPNPLSNKKKVRGWKKHVRNIEAWQEKHHPPNLAQLDTYGEVYAKFWIDPWFRLQRRLPPPWLRRKMATAMLNLAKDWQVAARKSDHDCEVRIYLHDPHFMASQLALCKKENALYFPIVEEKKKMPVNRLIENSALTENFDWKLLVDEALYLEKLDELPVEKIAELQKKAYKIETIVSGDTCYHLKTGDVWLGVLR